MIALVVDDSRVTRKVLIGALGRIGIEKVDQAGDGQEAIQLLENHSYDLILMDWNMPKKSGIKALTELRDMGITTPVIMVTTEAEKKSIVKAIKRGATNYIVKPFEPDTLARKIEEVVNSLKLDDATSRKTLYDKTV